MKDKDKDLVKELTEEIEKLNKQIDHLTKTAIYNDPYDYNYHNNVEAIDDILYDIEDLEKQIKTLI